MKSTKTRAEFNTMAMLLGGFYDHEDHTLCDAPDGTIRDADTLEFLCGGNVEEYINDGSRFNGTNPWDIRIDLVKRGVIGCADGPFNYEEDK